MKTIIIVLLALIVIACGLIGGYLALTHDYLTNTQLFKQYWYIYAIMIIATYPLLKLSNK